VARSGRTLSGIRVSIRRCKSIETSHLFKQNQLCEELDAKYDAFFGYDARGNINSISRYGYQGLDNQGIPQYGMIDDLGFNYTGANQLQKVTESADTERGYLGIDSDYTYSSGCLLTESGVRKSSLTYNFLNQPKEIQISVKKAHRNSYDGNGNLHRQRQYDENEDEISVRDYQDGIEYLNGQIQAIYHPEGRYVFTYSKDGNQEREYHEFQIADHLGNVRVRFADLNEDGDINIVDKGPGQEKEIKFTQEL